MLASQSLCQKIVLRGRILLQNVGSQAVCSTWPSTQCSPVIPPRNNRVTRSCWTSRLSQVSFAPHAAEFRCSWRRKCHPVGSKSVVSIESKPFFHQSGPVRPPFYSPLFSPGQHHSDLHQRQ